MTENSCHFVNLFSFGSSSFFLSLRKITWLNSQQPKTRGHVEHLGAHEIDFVKLSSKQIVISVFNRLIKSKYFMSWNWSTYWTSCVCLTFKPYKLHRELQYTCNWNRTRLFRIQSSEMQYTKRNHTKRLLAKIYYSSQTQSKVSIYLRLVQNACRIWAIAPGVT